MKNKILGKFVLIFLAIALAFAGGYLIGFQEADIQQPNDEIDFSLFWEAYNKLQDHYVEPGQIEDKEVVHGAIRGMLDSLDDPHTAFFDQKESKEFLETTSGYYQGIGMEVGMRNEQIQVISPIENTPAAEAGLQAGDVVVAVDGETTTDMNLNEAVDLMRGKEGTSVTIKVERKGEVKEFTLKRATIQFPSIEWELKEDNIAYLQIHYFHEALLSEFNEMMPKIISSSADTIILDLRNNPGGALEVTQKVASYFLEEGDVIVKSQGAQGDTQRVYKADNSSVIEQDLVILINEGTASASEILAEALRYHRDAVIVGEESFGKGSIQSLINMSGMTNLKVTVSHWVTPTGELLSGKGIIPDHKVEMNIDDIEADEDPQLDKAIELIKEEKLWK